ncbi:hypothetical protein JTB14_015449, partial [Gonioctena quinquepunctata]
FCENSKVRGIVTVSLSESGFHGQSNPRSQKKRKEFKYSI